VDNLQKLQLWYRKQCDGEWEHQYGVSIDALDNPGWTVVIDLVDTDLDSMQMPAIVEERTDGDWLQCKIDNGKFMGAGGPLKLNSILQIFLDLTTAGSDSEE
jgi:hypothetical protein